MPTSQNSYNQNALLVTLEIIQPGKIQKRTETREGFNP